MAIVGMPAETVVVFLVTLAAGWLAMIHYLVVHKLLGKPYGSGGGA